MGHIVFFFVAIFVAFWIARIVDRCEKCGSISGYDSKPIGYYHVYNCRKCKAEKEFK